MNEVNLLEVLEEIERIGHSWRQQNLRDAAIAAEVLVDALKQKFMKPVLESAMVRGINRCLDRPRHEGDDDGN